MDTNDKYQEPLRIAQEFAKAAKSFREMHNDFFGAGAIYGKMFPTQAEREEFSKSPEYREILRLRASLPRERFL
ncbi:MAG: hypothetical protein EXS16_00255 [Gemmataceae bacterium]|nr:hypothetical protein [Gemmataceae bacterium]